MNFLRNICEETAVRRSDRQYHAFLSRHDRWEALMDKAEAAATDGDEVSFRRYLDEANDLA